MGIGVGDPYIALPQFFRSHKQFVAAASSVDGHTISVECHFNQNVAPFRQQLIVHPVQELQVKVKVIADSALRNGLVRLIEARVPRSGRKEDVVHVGGEKNAARTGKETCVGVRVVRRRVGWRIVRQRCTSWILKLTLV